LIVLGVAFLVEGVTLGMAVRQAAKLARAEGLSRRQWLAQNRDASLLTVLVEDPLTLVGLPLAALAIYLTSITGDGRWDAADSMRIGALRMGFALYVGSRVRSLLIGRGLGGGLAAPHIGSGCRFQRRDAAQFTHHESRPTRL
jgi:hypothetical protein